MTLCRDLDPTRDGPPFRPRRSSLCLDGYVVLTLSHGPRSGREGTTGPGDGVVGYR